MNPDGPPTRAFSLASVLHGVFMTRGTRFIRRHASVAGTASGGLIDDDVERRGLGVATWPAHGRLLGDYLGCLRMVPCDAHTKHRIVTTRIETHAAPLESAITAPCYSRDGPCLRPVTDKGGRAIVMRAGPCALS